MNKTSDTVLKVVSPPSVRVHLASSSHIRKLSVRQNIMQYAKILSRSRCGGVPELADGPDLGSGAARRGGSSPPFPI